MTKKHFELIAATIAKIDDNVARQSSIDVWCGTCETVNKHFDRKTFIEAINKYRMWYVKGLYSKNF